jgi:aromatic ring hydroxylase
LSDFAYCDPNKDYDQFCRNNKSNEKRRALSLFYVNLMLLKIIPAEKIVEMIAGLQTDILAYIKKENSVNIVEEISELLFILITNSSARLKLMKPEWEQIVENISLVSAMKAKSEPSISNKTIFKHMDIKTAISK